jgi:23S rRNA pseudouridine2605 synthase
MREGRVRVNGKIVTELGTRVDPVKDHVKVDGRRIRPPERKVYYALYKPKRVMTTLQDPEGRPTVKDLLRGVHERVYPIGRLDYETEGLLLLTNDGALAARCMHPRHGVSKVYHVLVEGDFPDALLEKLEDGVFIETRPGQDARRTLPSRVKRLKMTRHPKQRTMLEIRLREGRNRQVRRMFARVGRDVAYLCRTAVGPVQLGSMRPGELRPLTPEEIRALKEL